MRDRPKVGDIPPEFLEGKRKEIHEVIFSAKSDNEEKTRKVKVRYRPRIVDAVKIDGEHMAVSMDGCYPSLDETKRVRNSGWLIDGPNNVVFYLPVEQFREWFDIVKED